jgi:beta-galactosidase
MKKPIYKRLILGTAYYPEHWDKSLWESDILRMKEHGLNLLRIGDFAWSKYEHKEGEFTIPYYDEFLELCSKHSMEVIFCTPTAAPPVWLMHKYPEILNRDINGDAYYGPRRFYNYNAPIYRKLCERIVDKLAEHYSKWDIIVGWQIDNELNCDLSEFYSEADHTAYRQYLKEKFGNLDNLNESLGLVFWSRSYSDWEQVTLNRKNVGGAVNPHLALEEKRFFSESAISFCALQVKAIKKHLPEGKFVTTNGLFSNLDYNKLMECGLDFITFDSYPNLAFDLSKDPNQPGNLNDRKWSWNLMWTRSVSPVFGIMEQQAGANGWTTRMETPAPKPGQMKLWTMQSIAHGADMVAYFRWRTSPIGCEIYWHGLNDYANTDNRRLRELKEIGQINSALESIRGTTYKAKVAVLKDYSNVWDSAVDVWHGRVDSFSDNSWFEATQLTHTPCDFFYLREQTGLKDLSVYEMLVYPHPAIMEPKTADFLKEYVENGGTLIFGARTGYKDKFGRCPMRPMPGLISEWCGVTVTDHTLVGSGDGEISIEWNGKQISTPVFNEVLKTNDSDTEILARFRGNYYDGQPALCHKSLGKGHVFYLGASFSVEMAKTLLEKANQISPYQQLLELPEAVELAVRTDGEIDYLFILNYKDVEVKIKLNQALPELISGEVIEGITTLKPFDVKIVKFEKNENTSIT